MTTDEVTAGSGKTVWWKCQLGHEWQARINSRTYLPNGRKHTHGCPYCENRKVNMENSLLAVNPKLANEWHPTKIKSAQTKSLRTPANGLGGYVISSIHGKHRYVADPRDMVALTATQWHQYWKQEYIPR